MVSRLTLCADDFGADAACTEAILTLARRGRLNAVTTMVTGAVCGSAAGELLNTAGVEIGLHVTLSGGEATAPSTFAPSGRLPNIDRLTAAAFAGRIPRTAVAEEIERQFDRFEAMFGRSPDFVDAHQHSHVLPGIRTLFLDSISRRAPRSWVRTCEERLSAIVRRRASPWRAFRSSLLSRHLQQDAALRNLRTNHGFGGLYNLVGTQDYGELFPRWLVDPGDRHLVICHPGMPVRRETPFEGNRFREFAYLSSDRLPAALEDAGVTLGPDPSGVAWPSPSRPPCVDDR
jgi:predicted glycoside hydrolase/deacetylase ChbG (UPF0249 family)